MKIIIIHYKPLKDRFEYYKAHDFFHNFEVEFLKADDREELDWCFNDFLFDKQKSAWSKALPRILPVLVFNARIDSYIANDDSFKSRHIPSWALQRELKRSEVSLIYKHHLALLMASLNNEPTLILEDDALLLPDTEKRIPAILSEFKDSQLDYLDVAGGIDLPLESSDHLSTSGIAYLHTPRSRTTAGYLISAKASAILAHHLLPLSLPLDLTFQNAFQVCNFRVGWCMPELFRHGSQDFYKSSIQ